MDIERHIEAAHAYGQRIAPHDRAAALAAEITYLRGLLREHLLPPVLSEFHTATLDGVPLTVDASVYCETYTDFVGVERTDYEITVTRVWADGDIHPLLSDEQLVDIALQVERAVANAKDC